MTLIAFFLLLHLLSYSPEIVKRGVHHDKAESVVPRCAICCARKLEACSTRASITLSWGDWNSTKGWRSVYCNRLPTSHYISLIVGQISMFYITQAQGRIFPTDTLRPGSTKPDRSNMPWAILRDFIRATFSSNSKNWYEASLAVRKGGMLQMKWHYRLYCIYCN